MEKSTQTHVETIEFTPAQASAWDVPEFQRPVKTNQRVLDLAEQIKADGGVIPGIICFGILDKKQYLIDGQQRRQAFLLSEKELSYADARFCKFGSMSEMAREFVNLNSHLVSMKPDDILRGLECSLPTLAAVRKACPFVGYDSIRRGPSSAILSMSILLRCWVRSGAEVPAASTTGASAVAELITADDTRQIIDFLNLALNAWGRDVEYARLWSAVNLTLCMWLYRRMVVTVYSAKTVRLTPDQFQNCLMGLSADPLYIDWLQGRHMGERDRAPAYGRLKTIFAKRLFEMFGKKPQLPAPGWAHGGVVTVRKAGL